MSFRKNTEQKFKLKSDFKPTGDQPEAIDALIKGLNDDVNHRVLLGVTGSGKTFTIANVIESVQRPTLIISHNKTLAAQLYQEFKEFFPDNSVNYFVSYYDYYQPEAYVPQTDTYIEKETDVNEDLDKLRLAATTNILTRKDTIVVASVSCIYNIGSPREYGQFVLELSPGVVTDRESVMKRLITLQYERNDYELTRGTFRARGDTLDIYPAYHDSLIRIIFKNSRISDIHELDPLTSKIMTKHSHIMIFPSKHFMTDPKGYTDIFTKIRTDLERQVKLFKSQNKLLEAQRISQRVNYDLEMIAELGYVNGIENYSRYFDKRNPGDPPYTLLDYFEESSNLNKIPWLLVIDESHMSLPQIRGMYNGDRSRKQTLIDYGFRLPAALDNRPLRFDEFIKVMPATIYVSATPNDWEINKSRDDINAKKLKYKAVVEQIIRPTGLIDPKISLRPSTNQISDLTEMLKKTVKSKKRVLVTTLTKRMSEDLTAYLLKKNFKVAYLHSDIDTIKRTQILSDLRRGEFDVIVGVNLLREGLDLPEVALVAILDADREGFLRSQTSLIQTMGRAARHECGRIILYADKVTDSIRNAMSEVNRRRNIQQKYNKKYHIKPIGIKKPIRSPLIADEFSGDRLDSQVNLTTSQLDRMTPMDKQKLARKLKRDMLKASRDLRFEEAIRLRDEINLLNS